MSADDSGSQKTRALGTRITALLILAIMLAGFAWESRAVRPQIDDAYISYRYARNLVEGRGLVFNPGERVEGMTNLAWTVAIAGGLALGVEAPVCAHVLGFLSGVALLFCTYSMALAGVGTRRTWLCALAPLPVLASNSFATWTLSGLETPLFVALTSAALLAQLRGRMGWATAAAIAATLTRPDGVLVAVVIYAAEVLPKLRDPRNLFTRPSHWAPVLTYAGAMIVLTAFRLLYYGSPVPNTFFAKVGGIPLQLGFDYCLDFFRGGTAWLLLPVAIGVWSNKRLAPGLCYVLLALAYTIYVGGDVFKNGRFLLPILPFLSAAAVIGIDAAFRRRQELGLALLSLLIAAAAWPLYAADALQFLLAMLLVLASFANVVRERLAWAPAAGMAAAALFVMALGSAQVAAVANDDTAHFPFSQQRRKAAFRNLRPDDFVASRARNLLNASPTPRLIASVAIGRLGYYSMLPILDILGLVDPHIARSASADVQIERHEQTRLEAKIIPGHQRSDPDYVLSRRPDYIFIPQRNLNTKWRHLPAVLDLWADPRLESLYVWDPTVSAYRRHDRRR